MYVFNLSGSQKLKGGHSKIMKYFRKREMITEWVPYSAQGFAQQIP